MVPLQILKQMTKFRILLFILILTGLLPIQKAIAQEPVTISGKVLYGMGKPVPDVSISIENGKIEPVYTDTSGSFSIEVQDKNSWLLIHPAHTYKAQRIYVGNQTDFMIFLTQRDNTSGHDKINTHLGLQEKRNIISSVSYRDNRNTTNYGYASIEQYFQGTMSGVYTINQSSTPGSGIFTSIRGANSIYATNQPLYVVDGVIMENPGIYENLISGFNYNPITSIKPEDISSVTVLKDASATAIYGIKGANGVVIIETLNTTETETKINLTAHTGIMAKPKYTPVLNSSQYRNYANELLQSVNFPEENIQRTYPGLIIDENSPNSYNYAHDTDWQNEIYKYGNTNNVYLSILGGDAVAKYGISFSYDDFNGIVDNSDFRRLGIRLVGNVNVLPWLKFYMNTYLSTANENQVEDMTRKQVSPQYVSMAKSPILGPYIYDKLGNPTGQFIDPLEFNISNPYAVRDGYNGEVNNTRILGSFRFEGKVTEQFKINTQFSLNRSNLTEDIFFPNIGIAPYENGDIISISKKSHNNLNALYSNTYFEYLNNKSGKHDVYVTAGARINYTSLQIDQRIAKNLPPNDAVNNLGEGEDSKREVNGDSPVWSWVSFYSSGRYGFKNKYFIDAVLTLDGSSTIGKEAEGMVNFGNQPYGLFYSLGAAWRLSNESFFSSFSQLNELKLRASYSVSGNDDIGTYSALDYYELVLYRQPTGIVPGRTKDLGLKHETMSMINFGVDLAVFGEKFKLTANVFENKTDDLFLRTQTEAWIWDDLLGRNSGSATTRGVELEAGTFLRVSRNLTINSSFNITRLNSTIDQIYKDQVVVPIEGGQMLYQSGSRYPQFYGYIYEGVYATSQEAQDAGLLNNANIPFRAGDAKFKDISGPDGVPDGKISDFDKTALGSPFPEIYGGWFNQISYKRWVLDLNFQFVLGNEIYNYRRYLSENMSDFSNQSLNVEQRWRQEGDETNTPRALLNDNIGNSAFSSRWIEDGAYVRLKSAAIRYIIPHDFAVFQNAEFYISGTNLYTFTNYLGDPEVGRGYQNFQQGIDYGLLPNVRTILFGVKLGL